MCCREREGEEEGELAAPATEGPVCDPLTKLHAFSWRFSVDTDQEDSEGPATLTPDSRPKPFRHQWRQVFHGPALGCVGGFSMIPARFIYCALYVYRLHQLKHRSSGIRSSRLGPCPRVMAADPQVLGTSPGSPRSKAPLPRLQPKPQARGSRNNKIYADIPAGITEARRQLEKLPAWHTSHRPPYSAKVKERESTGAHFLGVLFRSWAIQSTKGFLKSKPQV